MPFLDTTTIAICLAIFFLVAAMINTLVNRARRRRIENQRAAQTGGGTEEAPIHLTTPFSDAQQPPGAPTAASSAPSPNPAAAPAPQKPHDDEYVWE